ncbi:hypothetical protein BCR44DRAFT_40704 [Catenaria anguillulae PL171]|uniref:Uncharacterized protein n=1 Tax=Catenaria anguillulae PL171 TaxID=765915 RepID=A0A1Y2H8H4_9FUNG|nr:hypothetical protein BCR44DRAFT_40704 [Catenaria anguillulae PL171]
MYMTQVPQLPSTLSTAILVMLIKSPLDPTIGERVPQLLTLARPSPQIYQQLFAAAPWVPMEAVTAAGLPAVAHWAAALVSHRDCGPNVIAVASSVGRLDVLDWWTTQTAFPVTINPTAIAHAIRARQIHVLEWWFVPGRMGEQDVANMTGPHAASVYSRAAAAVGEGAILDFLQARGLLASARAMQLYAAAAGNLDLLGKFYDAMIAAEVALAQEVGDVQQQQDMQVEAVEMQLVFSQLELVDNNAGQAGLIAAFEDQAEAHSRHLTTLGRIACQYGHVDVLEWVAGQARSNRVSWDDFACVRQAVSHGQVGALEWLRDELDILFRESYNLAVEHAAGSMSHFLNWCVRMGHQDLATWHMRHILRTSNQIGPFITFQFLLECARNVAQGVLSHIVASGLSQKLESFLQPNHAESLTDLRLAVVKTRDHDFLAWWEATMGDIVGGDAETNRQCHVVLKECAAQGNLELIQRFSIMPDGTTIAPSPAVLTAARAHGQLHVLHWWAAHGFPIAWQPAAFDFGRLLQPTVGNRIAWVVRWWKMFGGARFSTLIEQPPRQQPAISTATLNNLARRGVASCLDVLRLNNCLPLMDPATRKVFAKAAARAGQLSVLRWAQEQGHSWLQVEWQAELSRDARHHPHVRNWLLNQAFAVPTATGTAV